jgi:tRNA G46 methylase TrmB
MSLPPTKDAWHSQFMSRPLHEKSTTEQIRQRFDADVERFSKLETGKQAAMDAPVILDVVSRAAACHVRPQGTLLDLGCGAGNFTLRVLGRVSPLDCVLVDLSRPMLERAEIRVKAATSGNVQTIQSDMSLLSLLQALSTSSLPGRCSIICAMMLSGKTCSRDFTSGCVRRVHCSLRISSHLMTPAFKL